MLNPRTQEFYVKHVAEQAAEKRFSAVMLSTDFMFHEHSARRYA